MFSFGLCLSKTSYSLWLKPFFFVGVRVLIVSLNFCASSNATYNFFLIPCNSTSFFSWVHICVLYSYNLAHYSSQLLILSIVVVVVFSLCSLS
jgi:hypothetical protein